jgi:hypothetical protein
VHPFPVGSELRLADGTSGVVVAVDGDDPERPLVRFSDGERHVHIARERAA